MKQIIYTISAAIILLSSCNIDGQIEELRPMAPEIAFAGHNAAYTVKQGRELPITPDYLYVDGAIFTWSCNGKVVGSEPFYTFRSEETGRHFLNLEVATRYGVARQDVRIDVVELEIPYVSLPGSENGYRILAGRDLRMEPIVAKTSVKTSYEWSIDGEKVSDERSYTFAIRDKGEYALRFEASNEDGSDCAEFTVQVCTPDEMPFSWHFDTTVFNTSAGRAFRLVPQDIENDFEVTYTWSSGGQTIQSGSNPLLRILPESTGTFSYTVTAVSPYIEPVSQTLTVNVYAADAHRRAATASSSVLCTKVHDFTPAPGQFISQISTSTDPAAAVAAAESILTVPENYVSLGSFGGYVVVGFDHSIDNGGGYDFAVRGNAFDNSSEPGIVWVMQDENGNGLPDDTWYELKGSEYGKPETIQDYAVTYYRPRNAQSPVAWSDNRGDSGMITLNPRYPDWIAADSYTLRGTRLAARNSDESGSGTGWQNRNFEWGYADNYSLTDRITDDLYNYFRISDAVDFEGGAVDLGYIDFVKIQCGINSASGWLGEISTEVLTVKDYNLEKTLN